MNDKQQPLTPLGVLALALICLTIVAVVWMLTR